MFANSKTEVLGQPAMKQQQEEIHLLRFERTGILTRPNIVEDFSRGVHTHLVGRGYHQLPGGNELIATYERGPELGAERFIAVVRIHQYVFVVYLDDLYTYKLFCKEHGTSI